MRIAMRFAATLLLAMAVAAPAMAQTYAIRGGTVHTLTGPPIENGTVVIRNGKIIAVGRNVSVPSGAQTINARGLHVYPGLFDSVTRLGLTEIGQVSATVDITELGDFNPHLVAASAVHPASEHIPVARANGVTHAVSAPGGGVISGQASLISLDGWVMDEMLVKRSVGYIVNWPTMGAGGGGFGFGGFQAQRRPFSEIRQQYERRVAEITDWLDRARHYAQAAEKGSKNSFQRDLKLEAMIPLVKGELPVLVSANNERDIKNAVEYFEKQKLKMVLLSGRQAWKVKDLLKEKGIPVILGPTQALPSEQDEAYDKPFSAAGELHAAGVKIAFATFNSSDSRTLPYEAANAVPFGLPWEEAVKAITRHPAEILGVGDQLGTIEQGKIANLIVVNGDPLEITTEVRYLLINGKLTSRDNRHQRLYETYRRR